MSADTIVRVDPKTLLVGPNVRKEITLPAEFVASVKEHGVKVPIVAEESKDGLVVIDGQMRTLAALDAGVGEVPVYVRAAGGSDAERVVDQLVVNRERTSLSRADTVAAVKQLALDFKMPAAAVAKKVGLTKKDVESVVAIAGSASGAAVLAHDDIDLEVAAKIAAADLTKVELKEVMSYTRNAEHTLQKILDARVETKLRAELTKEATASGLKIVERPTPPYSYGEPKNKHKYLKELVDKETGKALDAAEHATCPGHAASVGKVGGYEYRDDGVAIHLVCTDPAKYGHRDKNKAAPAKLTDEEKAQRQIDIARGKEWPSITTVRQTWIREKLLGRKSMPPAWEQFVARVTTGVISGTTDEYRWKDLAHELLQIEKHGYGIGDIVKELEAKPARADAVLVGIAIAKVEQSIGSDKAGWKWTSPMYLELLAAWGYTLSDLEQELVNPAKGKKGA